MVPSVKAIEAAIKESTCEVWKADPDATSVNSVRKHVEEKLDLEEGFLSEGDWKRKSKDLIKDYVAKLLDGWEPDEKKTTKRQSSEPEPPNTKRQKRSKKSEDLLKDEATLEEEEESPKKKASAQQIDTSNSDAEENAAKGGANSDEPNSSKADESKPDAKDEVAEEDEYSDVIDEPPPKRKKGQKKEPPAKGPKQAKASSKSTAVADDPLEAEIKKLQSQLNKCGVRKMWYNELKEYGNEAKAKIRHLKKMLAEIGMDGRFSEAKAREIKEKRELLADAEAAQEMDRLWGTGTGGRASRSKSKSMKVDDSDGSDAADDKEDTDEENTFAARRRRAQADLAFLGDESDSD